MFIRKIYIVICVCVLTFGYSQSYLRFITIAENINDLSTKEQILETVFIEIQMPVLLVGDLIFALPQQCFPKRFFGQDTDGRDFGEGADGRSFGEGADGRSFGEGADGRSFGEGADGRSFGEGADGRSFGEGVDGRSFGEGADGRSFGEDSVERDFGQAFDGRFFGEDGLIRAFDESFDLRNYGENALQRAFGQNINNRLFGDDFLQCEETLFISGEAKLQLSPKPISKIYVYDGIILMQVSNKGQLELARD